MKALNELEEVVSRLGKVKKEDQAMYLVELNKCKERVKKETLVLHKDKQEEIKQLLNIKELY